VVFVNWQDDIEKLKKTIEDSHKKTIEELNSILNSILDQFFSQRQIVSEEHLSERLRSVLDNFEAEMTSVVKKLKEIVLRY